MDKKPYRPGNRTRKYKDRFSAEDDRNNEGDESRIEGRNPVLEAFRSGRTIDKLLIAKGSREGSILQIRRMAKEEGIVVQEVDRRRLDEISMTGGAHQGVIAFVTPYSYVGVEDILKEAAEREEPPLIMVLDEITDPHNLGSIIRTAECSGVHGIIIPKRRAVGLSPGVIKASAGAAEFMLISKVTNIAATLDRLKENGLWIAGAHVEGELYTSQDLKGPLALVIGSEGKGLGRLVKEKCDFLVKIPKKGRITSLNASVAAGVLMYEVTRQRSGG
ncbi:MAG: 23S rRNA (guanosine(2251)-2'-O)-methyltransferase RlmB [Clostridiales bacterium]|nr:23S rRNA (guanosine(2251)-2'-O)-methyltransferase RlmB [Clostridiales bacterium]